MLELQHLAVAYGRHAALKGVDLQVAAGEIVVILGANGAGKTSLLKAVAGLVPCGAASQVRLDGRALTHAPAHHIVEAGLALVPEGRGIFGDLSVHENLLLGAFAQRARATQAQNLERVLALFPRLAERRGQIARTMSGGEQQMVAIGRALMSAPTILMLDEPSLGLSPLLCSELFKALRAVRDTGVGILLVEQNARQSLALADRAYLLENGQIVGQGPAAQLMHDPAVQAAYLGGAATPLAPAAVAPLPAAAPQRFTPGAAPSRSVAADRLIPTRIADLVRVAAQVQADDVERSRRPATTAGLAPAAETSLAEMLKQVEAAARQARAPAAPPLVAATTPTPTPHERPLVEVHRPRRLRIYRRGPDGRLHEQN